MRLLYQIRTTTFQVGERRKCLFVYLFGNFVCLLFVATRDSESAHGTSLLLSEKSCKFYEFYAKISFSTYHASSTNQKIKITSNRGGEQRGSHNPKTTRVKNEKNFDTKF